MHSHWDECLNVRKLLDEVKPSRVIELGAREGANTNNLVKYCMEVHPFELYVVNDDDPAGCAPGHLEMCGAKWIIGISYLELKKFPDDYFDFALVDTDHNYPTLKWELAELVRTMRRGGVVVMHDTKTYAKNNGMMPDDQYNNPNEKVYYPKREIQEANKNGLGMIDAINEVIGAGNFEKIAESEERQGAMALRRV